MIASRISDEEITEACQKLNGQSPEAILGWAVERFGESLLFSTAFGAEGCCILHMLGGLNANTRCVNLDTGYQFPETLKLRDRIRERYGIDVELIQPDTTVPEYEREHGGPLFNIRPDQCCFDRKIVPLRRAIAGHEAWISSIRRDQTKDRAVAQVVQWDSKFGLAKINPLLSWTFKDVWKFIYQHQIPYNPLHDQNYPSIGCWPCTAPVLPGGDERSGRWAGSKKKECGLHVIEHEGGSGI
jgi:phosphoadenosine phosphosulfate reductase